jgi:SulP family sulfate permease
VLLGVPAGGRGAGCLILDFARVDGADASALFAFTRLLQRARKQGRPVLFAAVPPGLARALPGAVAAHSFADLDHALEHAENAVLGLERTSAPQSGLDDLEAAYPAVGVRRQLMTYCERVSWRAGEVALRQGDPSDAMFFVESGQLTVWRERADGQRIRLSTIAPGTVIGEIGFYLGTVRSATVIADQPSSAFCITRPALQRMQDQDQALAVTFHRFIATVTAERLSGSIELLARAGP